MRNYFANNSVQKMLQIPGGCGFYPRPLFQLSGNCFYKSAFTGQCTNRFYGHTVNYLKIIVLRAAQMLEKPLFDWHIGGQIRPPCQIKAVNAPLSSAERFLMPYAKKTRTTR
jgi:hypothetical protein